ncbi:hypothetical protein FH07_07370 [Escherichia coli]|nr:hypothetical protein FH07_07370 [Escherichia coli]
MFVRSSFGLLAIMPACCLLRLISSWVHLSRSLAGLSTLPDQKLSWHAQRKSTHMSRWLRPSRSRIRRISLAHPAKFGFLADGAMVFTMSNIHSAAVRSSAVPHLLPL